MSSNKVKGIMCIISSAFCFALMNMFVRMAGDLPSIQKKLFQKFYSTYYSVHCADKNRRKI